jgi:adenine-specific DNA-methyltransferase
MTTRQKLELTWVGKEKRPQLEPRILLEDAAKSHHAAHRFSDNDIFDNRLIFGDNLLALKALEAEFAGKVKCVFIDPPYNTGSAFEHYDDGLEHSIWLSLMRDRLEIIRRLLSEDGSLWITIDDNEAHYLKVLCDEVFGRTNFVADIIWKSSDNSNNDAKQFSLDHNHVLVCSKSPDWLTIKTRGEDSRYGHFKNPDNDPRGPWFDGNPLGSPAYRENLIFDLISPQGHKIKPPSNGWRWSKETLQQKISTGEIRFTPDGKGIRRRTYLREQSGLPPSSLWIDLEETGHNRQAKFEQKRLFPAWGKDKWFATPKPEKLLKRILDVATLPGDLVLDSFAGSGTTGAVAHKMGRRWIMVELGEHIHTHIIPRLTKVIDGADPGGVTEATGWKGGGGYRYFRLAPSLLEKDQWGREIISPAYNAAMLAEALCKLEGFTYAPSESVWWQHGHSTERDFIYVTTQTLGEDQLDALNEEVGVGRSLLVLCSAFRGGVDRWPNLSVRKIPNHVRARCEWGHDDYSLNVRDLPMAADIPVAAAPEEKAPIEKDESAPSRARKRKQQDLFGG